jgi:uncharacterized protein (TIGR02271 family)
MALLKIKDFDPNYKQHFDNIDIVGFDLYSGTAKLGTISDILVEEAGNLRYLVVNTGIALVGKKILLPIGKAKFDQNSKRAYVEALSPSQIENLPKYVETEVVDFDYEEKVRDVYRTTKLNSAAIAPATSTATRSYDRTNSGYDLNDSDHQSLKLYEERLIADKTRAKTGEVIIGKRVETETVSVAVSLDKDRVIIERTASHDGKAVTLDAGAFQEGEVARMEVYEETANIRKEAFVSGEVNIRKIVETETANSEEQVRSERIEVTSEGKTVVRDDATVKK